MHDESQLTSDLPDQTEMQKRAARRFEADTPWSLRIASCPSMPAPLRIIAYTAHSTFRGERACVDIETDEARPALDSTDREGEIR
jgi:hypothetical protein